MNNDSNMYELAYPRPVVGHYTEGPVLVVALTGYADAGNSLKIVNNHLVSALENATIATFNMDELVDFRSRRPATTMRDGKVVDVETVELTLKVVKDLSSKPFLLLSGVEPDFRWNAFTEAVTDLVATYNVSQVVFLYSAAMNVPHTRPLLITAHGNAPKLWGDTLGWDAHMVIPGAAQLNIEHALQNNGMPVTGFTAQVPHYLGAGDYPEAAWKLLRAVGDTGSLNLPLKALQLDAERASEQIAKEISEHQEITPMVAQMEQVFDEELARRRSRAELARAEAEIPTADELGSIVEDFLASVDHSAELGEIHDHDDDAEPGAH
ncbi:proteasome protein [Corynebacterium sp. 13CS0277]|uniref:PAC2 family protein n=1 Tax=Corynebacterium sp. 13CS0277 TaxID=2071994 RepID=UPI000D039AE4|nr:PAC2 family protein [Corynebacterium sp. 13CS0277]PRQ10518.1 proteasome protein [Corynebacterium sp. 13CS0277]